MGMVTVTPDTKHCIFHMLSLKMEMSWTNGAPAPAWVTGLCWSLDILIIVHMYTHVRGMI